MSMGIFMGNQPEPVFWQHSPYINQESDWVGLQVAKSINLKRLNEWSRKNLDGALLPNMKAIVTCLEITSELPVHGINMVADPDTTRYPVIQLIH